MEKKEEEEEEEEENSSEREREREIILIGSKRIDPSASDGRDPPTARAA